MKKRTFLLTMASMLVAGPELLKAQASPAKKKSLVAYFSRRGYNYLNGEIVFLQVGNTEVVAKKIRELTGSDLFQIETVKSYPKDYNETTTVAKKEQNENARPELTRTVDGMDDYDVIYLGYPNWWGDMPQPLFTFLEEYDFSGKTIIPFNSHGGSGFSNTIEEIKEFQPDANISDEGLSISRDKVADSVQDVTDWAKSLDLSEE